MSGHLDINLEKLDWMDNKFHKQAVSNNLISLSKIAPTRESQHNFQSVLSSRSIHAKTAFHSSKLKKKSISSTSPLSRVDLKFVPGVFICLCFTMFNPVVTFFINTSQIDDFQSSLQFLSKYYFKININCTLLFF